MINAHAATNTYQLKDPTGKSYTITYTITGGKLLDMKIDKAFFDIIIEVQADNNGTIKIEFPRTLIDDDANIGEFAVLINGDEYDYEEMSATCDTRTLQIQFPAGSKEINLISPYPPNSGGPGGVPPFPREVGSMKIHVNEEIFTLNTNSTSKICTWNFLSSERKLEFIVSGDILILNQTTALVSLANSTSKYFQVSFPSRLLDGDFTVFMDGNKTNFQQGKNDINNDIFLSYHKSDVPTKIEIVGTSAIPEFPVSIMIASIAMGSILVIMRVRK